MKRYNLITDKDDIHALRRGTYQIQRCAYDILQTNKSGRVLFPPPKKLSISLFCKKYNIPEPSDPFSFASWIIDKFNDEGFKYIGKDCVKPMSKEENEAWNKLRKKRIEENRLLSKKEKRRNARKIKVKKKKKKDLWWTKYNTYLKSPEWRSLREVIFKMRGRKCEKCESTEVLHIHHLTYKNVFNEKYEDLQILCKCCHEKEHNKQFSSKNKKSTDSTVLLDELITIEDTMPEN